MENPKYVHRIYQENISDAIEAKDAFLNLANLLVKLPVVSTHTIGEAILRMEEEIDELLGKILADAEYEAGIVAELPESRFQKAWKASRKQATEPAAMFADLLKSDRIITNPQTMRDLEGRN